MKKQKMYIMFCSMIFAVGMLVLVTGSVTKAATTPEATIGDVEYETLQEALDDVKWGETVVLKKDITLEESIVISGCYGNYFKYTGAWPSLDWSKVSERITIDLNGNTISFNRNRNSQMSKYIPALVIMDLIDDVTIKNGTLKNIGTWNKDATTEDLLIYRSLEYDGSGFLSSGGEVVLENVKCYGNVYTDHEGLTIKSGNYTGCIRNRNGNLRIEGGTFAEKIETSSSMDISGGIFKNSVCSYNTSVDIYNGTFCKDMIIRNSDIRIMGGTFKSSSKKVPILTYNTKENSTKLNVMGGTIYKAKSGEWYQDKYLASEVKVTGGRFVSAGKKIQTIKVPSVTRKYQKAQLKKAKRNFYIKAEAKGKISYKVISGSKYVSVNGKGKVTVKKGTPKGTYKVRITAAATSKYEKETKVIKIVVK